MIVLGIIYKISRSHDCLVIDLQNVLLVGNDKIWLNLDQSYNTDAMNPWNNRVPGDY